MSYFLGLEKRGPLEREIDAVLQEMQNIGVNSDRYPVMMEYLERLNGVKVKVTRPTVSLDTIALVVGNLMGILLIVAYEQKHVMSSKGFAQIIRPK